MHPTLHTICHNRLHEKERLNFEAHFFKTTSLLHVSNSQLWSAGQVVDPIPTNLSGTLFSSLLLKSSVWVSKGKACFDMEDVTPAFYFLKK